MYREGAGVVPSDSLAAESVEAGGAFAQNRNIHTSTSEGQQQPAPNSTRPHETPADVAAAAARSEQGGAAPTYVQSQFRRDEAGPHGRNITEDPEMIGRPGKFNVEPGSAEDPGREAEKNLRLKQTRGAPGTGEREVGVRGAGQGEQPYEALGRETSA